MSAIQPPYEVPYPIVTDATTPVYEPEPVTPVEPVTPSRAAESVTERPEEATIPEDMTVVSSEARDRFREAADRIRAGGTTPENPVTVAAEAYAEAIENRNSRALRELLQTFQDYDNTRALERYNYYLNMFTRYGAGQAASEEQDAIANLRAAENGAYRDLGITFADNGTREAREGISRAIDRWFVGEGVFTPEMLRFSSSDGFRFTPLSESAQAALRSADVLASYERSRITTYLREMAALTPNDFLFYDPTGLESPTLQRRREFLERVDRMLAEQQLDIRAAELRYIENADGGLTLEALYAADAEELRRIQELSAQINTYYGQLINSVEQYDSGMISEMLA